MEPDEYLVEKIIDKKLFGNEIKYKGITK